MKKAKLTYIDAAKVASIIFLVISLLVGIVLYFGHSAFVPSVERPHFEEVFNIWATGFIILGSYIYLFVLFVVNFKVFESEIKERKKILIAIICSLVTALIYNSIITLLVQLVVDVKDIPPGGRIGPLIKDIVFATGALFLSLIIYLSSQKQRLALKYEALQAENERSRFEALKNQLDPHFLFNTFNSLDSLIDEDPVMARNYLQQLSSVFRYVLSTKEVTTLDNELKFTYSYINLMQFRYENSLEFEFSIDDRFLDCEIVPLSIQTLIENAIKHNVISAEEPLVIQIVVNSAPSVIVSNVIKPKISPQIGNGIGLSNLSERFKLKYQKEIEISNAEGRFVVVLPLFCQKQTSS